MKIRCNSCGTTLTWEPSNRYRGCGCDPDAPTWIAFAAGDEPRVMKMSHANYEVLG